MQLSRRKKMDYSFKKCSVRSQPCKSGMCPFIAALSIFSDTNFSTFKFKFRKK